MAIILTILTIAFITHSPNWKNMFEMVNIMIWIVSLILIMYSLLKIILMTNYNHQLKIYIKNICLNCNWLACIFLGSLRITLACILLNDTVFKNTMIETLTMILVSVVSIIYFLFLSILNHYSQKYPNESIKLKLIALFVHISIIFGVFDNVVMSVIAISFYAFVANIWYILVIYYVYKACICCNCEGWDRLYCN